MEIREKTYFCHKCDFSTYWRHSLTIHLRTIHEVALPKSSRICRYCQAVHNDGYLHACPGTGPFICEYCAKEFNNNYSRRRHVRERHAVLWAATLEGQTENTNRLHCKLCDFTTSSARRLRWHSKYMHRQTKYRCKVCFKTYVSSNNMRYHIASMHFPGRRCF